MFCLRLILAGLVGASLLGVPLQAQQPAGHHRDGDPWPQAFYNRDSYLSYFQDSPVCSSHQEKCWVR